MRVQGKKTKLIEAKINGTFEIFLTERPQIEIKTIFLSRFGNRKYTV